MSALTKIITRAKQIRKLHKNAKEWKACVKQAGAEYRSGKKVSGTKARKSAPKKKAATRTKSAPKKKRATPAHGHAHTHSPAGKSTAHLKAELRNRYKQSLATALLSHALTKQKRGKKKISKRITALKADLRKL